MRHHKIANWTTIRNMCRRCFAAQTAEELEMQAVELARQHTEDEVAAFEHEGEVAHAAMVSVLEDASTVAADVVMGKMHAVAARKVVEMVAMKAAMAALRAMRNDLAMVSLEAVAMEAAKVAVR
jgi:ABC-type methionine transport system ATPase subunit